MPLQNLMYRIQGDASEFDAATSQAQRQLDRLQGAADDAGDASERAAERSATAWVAAGTAISAVLEGLLQQITAVEEANRNLRLETGAASPAEQALLAGLVGEGVEQDAAIQAIGALRGAGPTLGVGDDLGVAETLASLVPLGADPTAASQALVGFGVRGPQAVQQNLDLAIQAGLSQGVAAGDVVTGLRDYGPVLGALGLNFTESAAFISDLNREGIDVSRVSPALNRFIRDASEAGTDPRTAAGAAFAEIAAASDIEAAALGQEYFGAEGGLRLTQAIRSGRVGLGEQLSIDVRGAPTLAELAEPTSVESFQRTLEAGRLGLGQGDITPGNLLTGGLGFARDVVGSLPVVGEFGQNLIDVPGGFGRFLQGQFGLGDASDRVIEVRVTVDPIAQEQGIEATVRNSRRSGRRDPYAGDPIGRGL